MLYLERVASASAPALEDDNTVGNGMYGRTLRGGIVDAQMGTVNPVYGVQTCTREARTYACELERRLEQLLAQRGSVILPILYLAVLLEGYGVYLLASVVELGAPDAAYADECGVYHLLVIDDGEGVALLYAEEVDRPLVYVLEVGGQRVWQAVAHDCAPE